MDTLYTPCTENPEVQERTETHYNQLFALNEENK